MLAIRVVVALGGGDGDDNFGDFVDIVDCGVGVRLCAHASVSFALLACSFAHVAVQGAVPASGVLRAGTAIWAKVSGFRPWPAVVRRCSSCLRCAAMLISTIVSRSCFLPVSQTPASSCCALRLTVG